jgi:hypothetical protein
VSSWLERSLPGLRIILGPPVMIFLRDELLVME